MRRTPKEVTLPNLKVYRAAWVATVVLAVIAAFALGRPGTPPPSDEPVAFDGAAAMADLITLAEQYPQRVAGSDADNRSALWVLQQFKSAGLETHIDGFAASTDGEDVALQNVWAVSPGETAGTILLTANRDVPPNATQGANNNASGVAILLGLARAFTVTAHDHTIVFLCTSGDAYGGLGARRYQQEHGSRDLIAALAFRAVATSEAEGLKLDGWSYTAKVAPPWLWLLAPKPARDAGTKAILPRPPTQVLRLAVPASAGSQAPFVAAGVPALTLTMAGDLQPPPLDTVDTVSMEELARTGTVAQRMLMAIDGVTHDEPGSGGTIFLTAQRTLPGWALALLLAAPLVPVAAVTVDSYARCRRARLPLRPAWMRAVLHLAPWLVLIAIVYAANLVGLLPRSPGAVIPPDSVLAQTPRYLRVVVLLALLVLAYVYAAAVERRLERRVPSDRTAIVFVAHASLLGIAGLILLVNPYSVLLILPAAVLWPLARPGRWSRSILPAYLGLIMIPLALAYYALQVGVGWKVWWYFFLLFESRSIPGGVAVLGVLFLSTAGMLAHTLYEREAPVVPVDLDAGPVPEPSRPARRRRPGARRRPRPPGGETT